MPLRTSVVPYRNNCSGVSRKNTDWVRCMFDAPRKTQFPPQRATCHDDASSESAHVSIKWQRQLAIEPKGHWWGALTLL